MALRPRQRNITQHEAGRYCRRRRRGTLVWYPGMVRSGEYIVRWHWHCAVYGDADKSWTGLRGEYECGDDDIDETVGIVGGNRFRSAEKFGITSQMCYRGVGGFVVRPPVVVAIGASVGARSKGTLRIVW